VSKQTKTFKRLKVIFVESLFFLLIYVPSHGLNKLIRFRETYLEFWKDAISAVY